MSHFRPCDRDTPYLLPPSLDDWLPKDHLARFVADIVDQLDLSALIGRYRGAGSAAYHPAMLLALHGHRAGIKAGKSAAAVALTGLAIGLELKQGSAPALKSHRGELKPGRISYTARGWVELSTALHCF